MIEVSWDLNSIERLKGMRLTQAGATDDISGLGDKHAQSEADTLVQPEQTSRWGVVMAGEEQLEGGSAASPTGLRNG